MFRKLNIIWYFFLMLFLLCKDSGTGRVTKINDKEYYRLLLAKKQIFSAPDSNESIGLCPERSIVKVSREAYVKPLKNEDKYDDRLELVECNNVKGWVNVNSDTVLKENKEFLEKNIDRIFFMTEFSKDIAFFDGVYSVDADTNTWNASFHSQSAKEFDDDFPYVKKLSESTWEISNDKTSLHLKKGSDKQYKTLKIKIIRDSSGHYSMLNNRTLSERGRFEH